MSKKVKTRLIPPDVYSNHLNFDTFKEDLSFCMKHETSKPADADNDATISASASSLLNTSINKDQKQSLKNILKERISKAAVKKKETALLQSPNEKDLRKTNTVCTIEAEKCQCTSCDNFINCPIWCLNNLAFDNLESQEVGFPLFRSSVGKTSALRTELSSKMLVQGVLVPKPMFSIEKTSIDEDVQTILKSEKEACTDLQFHMWPAVQRNFHVFMIGPSQNEQTYSYLPEFCSFCIEKNEKYVHLQKFEGPLCLILCSSTKMCHEVHRLAKKLLNRSKEVSTEVLTEDGPQANCDLLIAVPSLAEQRLKSGTLKLKRLCHFAIEDAHSVIRNYNKSMNKVFHIMSEIQNKRPCKKIIQVVVASQKWSVDLETLLKKLYTVPIVCFEDFLEATVYSKVQFIKKKLNPLHKCFYLIDILKKNYLTHRSVVFCSEKEIATVCEQLLHSGIECIVLSRTQIEDEICENEEVWKSLTKGNYKVLICTDALFEKMVRVQSAEWLIHFSFPSDWTEFGKRFECLAENLNSPLSNDPQGTPKSFIIFDQESDNLLFLEFFEVLTRNSIPHLELA